MTSTESILACFRRCWRRLVIVDLGWILLGLLILGPLAGLIFRTMLSLSGESVLADEEIAFFFLTSPAGWLGILIIGAVLIGLAALNQVALMRVVRDDYAGETTGFTGPFRFALAHAAPVLLVTGHLVARVMLVALPFLLAAAATYWILLTEYDINFYLQNRPMEFRIAIGIAVVLGAVLAVLVLRLASCWFLALPLVAFERVKPGNALRESRDRTRGQRTQILRRVAIWVAVFLGVSSLTTALLVRIGQAVIMDWGGSMAALTAIAGLILILLAANALAVNVLGNTTFSVLLYTSFRANARNPVVRDDAQRENRSAGGTGFHLSPARVAAVLLLVAVVTGVAGYTVLQRIHVDEGVQIIAHRGASIKAPENTLAAVERAITDSADWVEIDVQETADNRVVVFHDSDFKKTAGNPLKIWDATMEDLAELDIGSWFSSEFSAERTPTLEEVLEISRGKSGVLIELKYYGHDRQLEQRVLDIVTELGMEDSVRLMSLKPAAVSKLKAIRPDLPAGLLLSVVAGNTSNLEADFLAVNAGLADRTFINSVHRDGREVYVWTVNDVPTMITMLSRGVDGVITDRPAMARAVLAEWLSMEPVERLVLDMASVMGVLPDGEEYGQGDDDA